MTFLEQVVATLIGTSGGFIGSLLLFWIKQAAEKISKEKKLMVEVYMVDIVGQAPPMVHKRFHTQ